MDLLLFFLLGIVFTICLYHGTININIHHTIENNNITPTEEDLKAAYKQMNESDPEMDKLYATMGDIRDIMEGSDRVNDKENI